MSATTLTAYRVAPQMEFKADKEFERAGIEHVLPTEEIERITRGKKSVLEVAILLGYAIGAKKPSGAKYIGMEVGPVSEVEIIRLKTTADRVQEKRRSKGANPFSVGQPVLAGEVPGVVAHRDGETCMVAVTMLGKQHLRPLHYSRLRPG